MELHPLFFQKVFPFIELFSHVGITKITKEDAIDLTTSAVESGTLGHIGKFAQVAQKTAGSITKAAVAVSVVVAASEIVKHCVKNKSEAKEGDSKDSKVVQIVGHTAQAVVTTGCSIMKAATPIIMGSSLAIDTVKTAVETYQVRKDNTKTEEQKQAAVTNAKLKVANSITGIIAGSVTSYFAELGVAWALQQLAVSGLIASGLTVAIPAVAFSIGAYGASSFVGYLWKRQNLKKMAKRYEELCNKFSVSSTATEQEFRAAYRKQSIKHHPDKNGDPEKFIELCQEFEEIISIRFKLGKAELTEKSKGEKVPSWWTWALVHLKKVSEQVKRKEHVWPQDELEDSQSKNFLEWQGKVKIE